MTPNRIKFLPGGSKPAYGNQFSAIVTLAISLMCEPIYAASTPDYEWWAPPVEQQGSISLDAEVDGQLTSLQQSVRKFSTTDDPVRVAAVSQASSSMVAGAASLHFASSATDREQVAGGGVTMGAFTAYSVVGSGEKYSRTSSEYAGLDPYKFHGGSNADYRFHGAGVNLDTAAGTSMRFGFTSVEADRLETRRASYLEFSSRWFFGRYTHIERGGTSVGRGLDAGLWLGRFKLGYQALKTRSQVSTRRLRLQWNAGSRSRLWIDYSRHRNALYQDHEDDMFMVTFQRSLGRGALLPLYAAVDEPAGDEGTADTTVDDAGEEVPEAGGFRRGYLLAGGAVAAVLVASSGSGSQDEAPRSNGQHEAARAALNFINPRSVRENVEYGAYIYRNPDGTFVSSDLQQGDASSVSLPPLRFAVPPGAVGTASWHTHAGPDPRFDNENFSATDLESDRDQGIDGYLGTPGGQFKYHEVSTDQVTVLGTVNN